MHALEIQEQARQLMAALGPKAVAEAARKAQELEASGQEEEARDWRRIESALSLMMGPRAS